MLQFESPPKPRGQVSSTFVRPTSSPLRLIIFQCRKIADSIFYSVVCFTPDAHVASSTLNHRALLGTCHETRKKALTRLNILTLLRHDPSTGSSTEFRIPFDFERTCFCIGGWEGHGIDDERPGKLIGMDFAKKVKRLAFVVPDARMPPVPSWGEGEDIECLALILFHNAAHIGWIERSASDISKVPTQEVLSSRLSLQPFAQKTMVKGFPMTKVRGERRTLFYRAMRASCN